jgi:hypothetical protein
MSRASSDALDALHAAVADVLTAKLKGDGVEAKDIAVAIKFLKDNGVDAPATSPRFSGIVEELKNLQVDDPSFLTN